MGESAERACFVFDVSFATMLTRFLNRAIFLMRSQNCWNGVQSLKEIGVRIPPVPPSKSLAFMRVFERGLRAPRIHSRIQKLQPHLSFLLRSGFADPYHLALGNIKWVFVCDDFDNLSPLKFESPHESEPFWRAIDYQAGKPFRNSFKINHKTGTFFQGNPL
jgi:hypothetical protein